MFSILLVRLIEEMANVELHFEINALQVVRWPEFFPTANLYREARPEALPAEEPG